MKRVPVLLSLGLMFLGMSVKAQAPQGVPKPGSEIKRLAFNIGTWRFEHNVRPYGGMRGGKFSATQTCDWYSGGFFIQCQWESTGPTGPSKGTSFLGYDQSEKVYTYRGFESTGAFVDSKGKVDGSTWRWTSDSKMAHARTVSRVTIQQTSPTEYTFRLETSRNGGEFVVIEDSRARKVTGAHATREP